MSDEHEVVMLRRQLSAATQGIVASPTLPERAAVAARSRRRRVRLAGAGFAVLAVTAVAVGAAALPFDRSADSGPATEVRDCPAEVPMASNPGLSEEAMLPARPGGVLACRYVLNLEQAVPSHVLAGFRVLDGQDAAAEATAINSGSVLERPRRCPQEPVVEVLFFRNAAGHEAVVVKAGCAGTTDGRRVVDPSPLRWLVQP
ncbi:hypothetical protein [Streptodolium elevatio]|uniref:Uncharacterized protein n=1 Tax=Streptodolium elevatio TaxID=3157996 RepID=A0ABV3DWN3_9ACTN